jgi:hypothetical protein
MIEGAPFHVAIATDDPEATRALVETLLGIDLVEIPGSVRREWYRSFVRGDERAQ